MSPASTRPGISVNVLSMNVGPGLYWKYPERRVGFKSNGMPNSVACIVWVIALLMLNLPRNKLPAAMGLLLILPKAPVERVVSRTPWPSKPLSSTVVGYSLGRALFMLSLKPALPEAQSSPSEPSGRVLCQM